MGDFHKPSRQLAWASMRPLASQLRPCAACALPPKVPKTQPFLLRAQAPDFQAQGAAVLDKFEAWVEAGAGGAGGWAMEAENWEGWRVAVDEGEGRRGWVLLRSSLHDPLLVLNVESDVPGGAHATITAPGYITMTGW